MVVTIIITIINSIIISTISLLVVMNRIKPAQEGPSEGGSNAGRNEDLHSPLTKRSACSKDSFSCDPSSRKLLSASWFWWPGSLAFYVFSAGGLIARHRIMLCYIILYHIISLYIYIYMYVCMYIYIYIYTYIQVLPDIEYQGNNIRECSKRIACLAFPHLG